MYVMSHVAADLHLECVRAFTLKIPDGPEAPSPSQLGKKAMTQYSSEQVSLLTPDGFF